jgi:hypothetical protein
VYRKAVGRGSELSRTNTFQVREQLEAAPDYHDHGFVFTARSGLPLDKTILNSESYPEVMRKADLGRKRRR